MEPALRRVVVRGIDHAVLEWTAPAGPAGATVMCLHGFADCARSWDDVAGALALAGHRVIAPDLRGYGDTGWIGAGGYYHFADYVADVAELCRAMAPGKLALCGHSMGGTIAVQFAGTFPDRVAALALLEGLGPPAHSLELVPDRYARWIRDLEAHALRPEHRAMASIDDAVARLRAAHAEVPGEVLRRRAGDLTRPLADGRLVWKHDPLHRTISPVPFLLEAFHAFLSRVACPALFVSGGPAGFHPDDEADRAARLRDLRQVEIADAGHMMHWTRPREVALAVARFLAEAAPSPDRA